MDDFDRLVRAEIYRSFISLGRAPVAAEIAASLSETPGHVEDALRRLHDAHLIVLAPGSPYIWMANPLSALPTPYAATCTHGTFWGNCIWDALGILAMLSSDGTVMGLCPDCGDEQRLEVRDGELVGAGNHLIHYTVPAAHWWDDIGFN